MSFAPAKVEAKVDVSIPFDQETILSDTANSKLNNLLDKLRKITGMSSSSQSMHLTLNATGKDERIDLGIDVQILFEDKGHLADLERRLHQELAMVYFILDETWMTRTIDKRIKSETHWHDALKLPADLMEMKRRIVWLTYELNRCQFRILEMAQSGKMSYIEHDVNVQIVATQNIEKVPARFNPLMRPLTSDCKPNITFETFTLIREFIFIKKDIDPALRFQLVRRLEAHQLDQLLSDPHGFFLDIVRCLGMSAQEFINACFKYEKDGKLTGTTRCPCGMRLGASYDDIHDHDHYCEFNELVIEQCPTVYQDALYSSSHKHRVMGSKETAYIVDVIKKRMPREEWKKTFLGEIAAWKVN